MNIITPKGERLVVSNGGIDPSTTLSSYVLIDYVVGRVHYDILVSKRGNESLILGPILDMGARISLRPHDSVWSTQYIEYSPRELPPSPVLCEIPDMYRRLIDTVVSMAMSRVSLKDTAVMSALFAYQSAR